MVPTTGIIWEDWCQADCPTRTVPRPPLRPQTSFVLVSVKSREEDNGGLLESWNETFLGPAGNTLNLSLLKIAALYGSV